MSIKERVPELGNKFSVQEVLIAGNRGPCGGVNMSLEAADQVLTIVDGRELVWTNWNVVNNRPIMRELEGRRLRNFRNNFDLVPDGSIVLFSAHGVPPLYYEIAQRKNLLVIDVTCQLVNRVHSLAKKAEREGKHVIYIGVNGHPETIGVIGELRPENVTLVENIEDAAKVIFTHDKPKVVYSQTTLLPKEVIAIERRLLDKLPDIQIPNKLDICYAMYNRQAAVEQLLENSIDLLLVVGSEESHNSNELRHMGDPVDIPAYLVDKPEDINTKWFTSLIKRVGITAGASVLDRFTEEVISWFKLKNPSVLVNYRPQVIPEGEKTFVLPDKDIEALRARYAA